jgi:hypothetical protein
MPSTGNCRAITSSTTGGLRTTEVSGSSFGRLAVSGNTGSTGGAGIIPLTGICLSTFSSVIHCLARVLLVPGPRSQRGEFSLRNRVRQRARSGL